jgi:NTP pyrophosphatase (non-canonical NTP hydrolase)
MCRERGFDNETLGEAFILFSEEVGELARIVRKSGGIKTDIAAKKLKADEELADLFIYLLHIANILNIDLEDAFRKKEEINKQRNWV